LGEEAEIVTLVERGCGGCGDSEIFGVTGGADAGCSVEGVYFEAGVVGDEDVAGSVEGIGDGFEACVGFESGLVFGWDGDGCQVGEWGEGDSAFAGGGEVTEFSGV